MLFRTSKYFILFFGSLFSFSMSYAQKFGYIDAEFVLKKMDAYQKAEQNIAESASKWQEDIDKRNTEVEKLRKEYLAQEILLTDEMKAEKKAEIQKKEDEARDMQKKIFGYQGLFFSRQQELIKPAMEELYKAVEKVARKNKLQFMFTNTEGLTVIYAEPRHDYTQEVLKELGLDEENKENPEQKKKE